MLPLVCAVVTNAVSTVLTFDYNWKFHLGDPSGVHPALTAAGVDPSFTTNISGLSCTYFAYAARRPVLEDCRGICSTTPGCLAWQYGVHAEVNGHLNSCFIHDPALGSPPVCSEKRLARSLNPPPFTLMHGESRAATPPPLQKRRGVSFKERAFNDSAWLAVTAPHDFVMSGAYTEEASLKHGFLPRNISGWYRKTFNAPAAWEGGTTSLHFDGVFLACDIFLNEKFLLRHTAGYLGFDVRLDAALEFGAHAKNVLAIRVDASFGSGHWYEGGGLVRKVMLLHTPTTLRFAPDGIFALSNASTVPASGRSVVVVPTAEVLADERGATALVRYSLVDRATGDVVAESSTPATPVPPPSASASPLSSARRPAGATLRGAALVVNAARRWSGRRPSLYTLVASLIDASTNSTVDSVNITIGLRHIDWAAPGGGFALNGEPVQLRGFSHHQDFGGVGAAVPDRVNLFRVNALRSVGGNTWRTSHNPYSPVVYDIMDTLGVMCWDENRLFTMRNTGDMEGLVRRDRNHASVIIWSACNEVECVTAGAAHGTAKLMRDATKKWDTTRPFSANSWMNGPNNSSVNYLAPYLDVEGFSHGGIGMASAATIHAQNPGKAMVSSECCSCETQRGEDFLNASVGISYPKTLKQAQCMEGCMAKSYPYWRGNPMTKPAVGVVAGTLGVWTLFDYAGEPGPWPLVVSSFGQFDLAGFAKSASYWYKSLWLAAVASNDTGRPPLPALHVVRVSQTWDVPPPTSSAFGTAAPLTLDVQVFSDLPLVELLVNGRSLGSAPCGPGSFASFAAIAFVPGNLTAVGRQTAGGGVLAKHTQLTSSAPASIELTLDAPSVATGTGTALLLDGHDAALVRATIRDAAGRVVSSASNVLTFEVQSGPGRVVGVHNGDGASHEPQVAASRSAYHGLARAVVKVTVDAASASAANLKVLANEIEIERGDGNHMVRIDTAGEAHSAIVITATSPGLATGSVAIPVSADTSVHSILAVAAASSRLELAFD